MRSSSYGGKLLQLQDGNTIVAGVKSDSIAIWKFLPSGALDASFGYNGTGYMRIPSSYPSLMIKEVQQQRDKKFVVLADAENIDFVTPGNTVAAIMLIRFNSNGRVDSTFNGTGYLFSRPLAGHIYVPQCMTLDTTGTEDRIFVGSFASVNGGFAGMDQWSITKYKKNGALDSSFNNMGHLQGVGYDINPGTQRTAMIQDMKVLPNGRLQVAGSHRGSDKAWFLFRLKPDGSYDNTYANNGRVYKQVSFDVPTNALSIGYVHADGSATMTAQLGYSSGVDSANIYIIRFKADGTVLSTFGNNGIQQLKLTHSTHHYAFDSARRVLISWYAPVGTTKQHQQVHFVRLTLTGAVDTSFGNGSGHVISEPVLNDAFYNRSNIQDVSFTPDFKGLTFIANRSTLLIEGFGIYRYKFIYPKPVQSVGNVKLLDALVYPVPAHDKLYITAKSPIARVQLANMAGQTVQVQSGIRSDRHMLSTASFAPGQYLLSVQAEDGSSLQRTIMIR